MKIFGYRINQTPAEVTENLGDDLDKEWPNLNDAIRNEVNKTGSWAKLI